MLSKIIKSIEGVLREAFDNNYSVYTERPDESVQDPYFTVSCAASVKKGFAAKQFVRENQFTVRFISEGETAIQERFDILDQMFSCLECITVDGVLLRGTSMHGEIEEKTLTFHVNFDLVVVEDETGGGEMNAWEMKTDVRKEL